MTADTNIRSARGRRAGADATGAARYIVVEGPIGVGKTALATRLADEFGAGLVLERPQENPFLERFYRSGRSAALPTQLFFLFQRAQQIEELHQEDLFSPVRVADFLLGKDRLFAEINLDREELELYRKIHERLKIDPPAPDLVVYLQAPADVLLRRIARRGVEFETMIERGYLEKLADAYARFFHAYDESPLLIVNAAHIDPVHNETDFRLLAEQIRATTSGRHFFNPTAAGFG